MKWSEAGSNSQAVLIIQKDPLSWDGVRTALSPRGFGFSLAIQRSLGFCAQWVCLVPGGVCGVGCSFWGLGLCWGNLPSLNSPQYVHGVQ